MNARMETVKEKLNEARMKQRAASVTYDNAGRAMQDAKDSAARAQKEFDAVLAEWMKQ